MENEIIESAYPARGNVLIVMGAEGRERASMGISFRDSNNER